MNDISDTPPEEERTAFKLDDAYDSCLLGATVDIYGRDRYAYSLVRLIRFEMKRRGCTAQEARQAIADEMVIPILREHGMDGPTFINDELIQGEVQDEDPQAPKIILPSEFNKKPRGRG